MVMTFSGVLTGILLIPLISAILILLLPKDKKDEVRIIAAMATGIVLLLALGVFFGYSVDDANAANDNGQTYFAYEDHVQWIESIGVSWHLGVDGISAPMVLLTALAGFAGVLISWGIEDRTREFMAFFLLLVAGVLGVFMAVDLFVLFFFYELAIFPMYFLIVIWGWVKTREYAAMKLTLYILIGSVVALVGMLALYFKAGQATGVYSFDFVDLQAATKAGVFDEPFSAAWSAATTAKLWFPAIFIGFGVLAGVWPFHNWSPDGHVAAPTAVSTTSP